MWGGLDEWLNKLVQSMQRINEHRGVFLVENSSVLTIVCSVISFGQCTKSYTHTVRLYRLTTGNATVEKFISKEKLCLPMANTKTHDDVEKHEMARKNKSAQSRIWCKSN